MGSLFKITLITLLFFCNLFAKNPIYSPTFDDIIKDLIKDEKFVFDDKNINVSVPKFADNPVQVPIYVDAKKIKDAKRLILFADLNPIPLIIDMNTLDFLPIISFNIKVAQETPLRALVKDSKGLWHIGSANIKSFGGGCSVASSATNDKNFDLLLGKAKSQVVKSDNLYRIKFNIFHPMETGLVFGATEFYVKNIKIYSNDKLMTDIITTSAISENPNFLLETKKGNGKYNIKLLDTDFNEYEVSLGK